MNNNTTPSLLADVTFEDIMSEVATSSEDIKRSRGLSGSESASRRNSTSSDSSIKFSIVKNYGKLSKKKNAATFALVDWNGYKRYDLRSWSEDYSTPYKGITFSEDEIPLLLDALSGYTYPVDNEPQYIYSAGKAKAKIFDSLCTLSSSTTRGVIWLKQVNIVDWGHGRKFDFRKWTEDYGKCSKGICLSEDEVDALVSIFMTL